MATAGAAIASGMLAAEATTVAAAMRPSMATGPTAVVVITDMATAVADRTVVVDMATVVVDMATVVADMLVAVMLLVPVVVAVATLAVVVAAMLAVAAVMLAVAAVMLAVAAAAMLVAAAMDMVVTADTSKRQPPSQSAHYARSGGASQLRRFAFASLFYRSSSSSMVLKSVFSSRYLTITGA
jgi:hypothetical protein